MQRSVTNFYLGNEEPTSYASADQPSAVAATFVPHENTADSNLQAFHSDGSTLPDGHTAMSSIGTASGNDTERMQMANQEDNSPATMSATTDGQGTSTVQQPSNPDGVTDDTPLTDNPRPLEHTETNQNSSLDEEEEQPYWASFEEDKSSPSEEELKRIEQLPSERDALDRKYLSCLPSKASQRLLILCQTITGRNWRLKCLTTPSMYLRQQGAFRGL